ncbi:MAG: cyanophycinase [Burkholderiales bacterium PBB5]|nr:MAG: cyanophycinase [Burkholderiales bacterium PBB5]
MLSPRRFGPLAMPTLPARWTARHLGRALAAVVAAGWLAAGPGAVAQAQTTAAIDPQDRGSGTAVAIGGGLKSDNDEIYNRLIAAAGGKGGRWVVFGTASENPNGSAAQVVQQFKQRGVVAVALPVSPLLKDRPVAEVVRDPALVAQVRAARGVYFTGGAQARIVDSMLPGGVPTPLLQAIWAVYRAGGVVAGTSAGAAIMSSTMFRDAPDVLGAMKGQLRDGQEVDRGLGFMGAQLFVDQHFLKRGRIGRMLPLMRAKGYVLGLGVEENSAAVMQGDTVEVIGRALVANLADARSDAAVSAFNLSNIRVSLLDTGDTLRLSDGRIAPSAAKGKGDVLDPATPGYKPYYSLQPFYVDMLGDNVIATAMAHLIDGSYTEAIGIAFHPRPEAGDALGTLGFEFRLHKGPGSIGWTTEAGGGEDYTVRDVRLDIRPIRLARPLYTPWSP